MEREHKTIYDKAIELYDSVGVSAVCEYANKLGLPYHHCVPCESSVPTLDKACLVCGTDNLLLTNQNK